MVQWKTRSRRKVTGGVYKRYRKKKKFQRGRVFAETSIGEAKVMKERTRGGNLKLKLKRANSANVTNPKTNKTTAVEIVDILENPANPEWVRRDIITKGVIIETKLGKARVTSRPGQQGVVNAVLIS